MNIRTSRLGREQDDHLRRVARLQAVLGQKAAPAVDLRETVAPLPEPPRCRYRPPLLDVRAVDGAAVGILSYRSLPDVQCGIAATLAHTPAPRSVLVLDNSEDAGVSEWAATEPKIKCVQASSNLGCANGRNWMASWFVARGYEHFVLMDQDVEPVADAWVADMRSVFQKYPDTGVVTWQLATRQMSPKNPDYQPDETGVIAETPGMCCMYSRKCIEAVVKLAEADGCPDCRPWNMRMLMYRFDTLFCLLARKAGYKTRVVWPDTDKIRHNHPHKGVQSNARWREQQARSRRIFATEVARHELVLPRGL